MTNKTKQVAEIVEQPEIMPVDSITETDYEQTNVKPPRIKQIEQYVQKREDVLLELDKRVARVESQRPSIVFRNDSNGLHSLEKALAELKAQQQTAQDQITFAKDELKREVDRWIKLATQKRIEEKKALENRVKEIESKVQEHLTAISELQHTQARLLPGDYLTDRLKEQLKFGYYNDLGDIRKEIHSLMGFE